MNKLKATTSGEIRTRNALLGYWWYEKSEADKVIEELEESHKKEVVQLLVLNREQANAANRLRDSMEQALRHQKYKRCLAMAKWCAERVARIEKDYAFWRYGKDYASNFYKRWQKRCLELAEQFKETK